MPAAVNIYHGAFRDEDVNKRVFRYTDTTCRTDDDILERAFEMFNAPPEFLKPEDVVISNLYREEKLRSLSVGDVVEIDHIKYICQPVGWQLKKEVDKAIEERKERKQNELIKYHGQFMKRKDVEKRKAEARKDLIEGLEKMIEAEKKKEIDKGIEIAKGIEDLKKDGWKEVIEPWP